MYTHITSLSLYIYIYICMYTCIIYLPLVRVPAPSDRVGPARRRGKATEASSDYTARAP